MMNAELEEPDTCTAELGPARTNTQFIHQQSVNLSWSYEPERQWWAGPKGLGHKKTIISNDGNQEVKSINMLQWL